ncbi:STAS domain-containing protein [Streptomyces capparidis]
MSAYTMVQGHEIRIALIGEMDFDTAADLRERLSDCLRLRPRSMVVDLSAVTFCDCSGLNVLLWARRRALASGAAFQVRSPAPQPARTIALTGTAQVLGLGPRSVPMAS